MREATCHILHVITTISRGGAENHLFELIKSQVGQGFKVSVAYLKGDGYWRNEYESIGVLVVDLRMGNYGELRPIFRLLSVIRKYRPSIVHAHLPPAELYTRLSLIGITRTRIPLIISKHNDERFYKGPAQKMLGSWVAKRAERLIAISDAVRNYMIGGEGLEIPSEKIVTIRYGLCSALYEHVDQEQIRALRSAWGITGEEYLIGSVARFVPQKALHVLLEGFALYYATATRSAKLVLIGTGPLEFSLKRLAEELRIHDRVVWAGFREDIPVVMNTLDVFALTSVYEGFGLVLLEAMASGRPVVASSVSAIPEILLDRVTGILFPPARTDLLAAAFRQLESDSYREFLGRNGRERVKTEFTVEKMVESTDKVYGATQGERK